MGKRKSGQNVQGILLLDKRLGVSSNRALQEVRRLLNANKAGHTGSLDPLATGLLPLCFGEATKVSALMLDDHKRYEVTVQLGVMTDTGDAEGVILATKPVPTLSASEIEHCLQQFTGVIEQVPPMYSALKYNGKKLYELAREGKVVERKARRITIFELTLVDRLDDRLMLEVLCSKGTYIRSLAEDIGHYLGCGGTVTALRRTQAGQFLLKDAWHINQLEAMPPRVLIENLMPMDTPLKFMPAVQLSAAQALCVQQGQRIDFAGTDVGMVRLYHEQNFLGLGEMRNDATLAPKRMLGSL
ncbi:MAG: tRNA pseudouridine(55) synthase TruB [Methylococcaceae bacterium]|nr:tRNA pseudouridine(55) synthase TruB [Methylococcaceae bacterium]